MSISTEITAGYQQVSRSDKKATFHWTPEQCRIQNIVLLAGCHLAERLEILLTLPGAELLLRCNNHSVKYLTDAIEHWYSVGDRWMEVFGEAGKKDPE